MPRMRVGEKVNGYGKMVVGVLETFSQLTVCPNPTTQQHDGWDGGNSFSLYTWLNFPSDSLLGVYQRPCCNKKMSISNSADGRDVGGRLLKTPRPDPCRTEFLPFPSSCLMPPATRILKADFIKFLTIPYQLKLKSSLLVATRRDCNTTYHTISILHWMVTPMSKLILSHKIPTVLRSPQNNTQ